MGRAIVDALVTSRFQCTMLNRGKRHWGDVNRYPGVVNHIIVDREDGRAFATALRSRVWHAIVDLACFKAADLAPIVEYASEMAPDVMYVFISSDSVYEVCQRVPGVPPVESHDHLVDASLDEYGAGKLEVEKGKASMGQYVCV